MYIVRPCLERKAGRKEEERKKGRTEKDLTLDLKLRVVQTENCPKDFKRKKKLFSHNPSK